MVDSFVAGSASLKAYETRLLVRLTGIGNVIKAYCGAAAGTTLPAASRSHPRARGRAAGGKSDNAKAQRRGEDCEVRHGNQGADLLSTASLPNSTDPAARIMMKMQLDQVMRQAVDQLRHKSPCRCLRGCYRV